MRQIMVPLDGSEFSEQALGCAYALASRTGARLHLVKVQATEPLTAEAFFFNLEPQPGSGTGDQAYLDSTRIDAQRNGVDSVIALLRGRVVDTLGAYCVEQNIDFVDAYHAFYLKDEDVLTIATFDRKHFGRGVPDEFMGLDVKSFLAAMREALRPVLEADPLPQKGEIELDFSRAPKIALKYDPFETGEAEKYSRPG